MTDNCSRSRSRASMSPRDQSLYYSLLKAFLGASSQNTTIGTLAPRQGNQQFFSDWSLGPTRKMSEGKLFDVIPMSLKVYLLMKIYHRELL